MSYLTKKASVIMLLAAVFFAFSPASFADSQRLNPVKTVKNYFKKMLADKNQPWRNCFKTEFNAKAASTNFVNSYLLMYVSLFAYDTPFQTPSFESFKKQFSKLMLPLGFNTIDFINVCQDNVDTQAMILTASNVVIVVFRGSETAMPGKSFVKVVYDWLYTDLNFFQIPFLQFGNEAKIHTGFYKGVDIVYKKLCTILSNRSANFLGKKPIWVTGHSLGAGLAPVAAVRLKKDGYRVQGVCTFGGPRVCNRFLADIMAQYLTNFDRWVFDNDIVVKLPFKNFGFAHIVPPNNIYSSGECIVKDIEMKGVAKIPSHYPMNYLIRIYNLLSPDEKSRLPLIPPKSLWPEDEDLRFQSFLNKLTRQVGED